MSDLNTGSAELQPCENRIKYQGTKQVYGRPMTRGDYNKLQGWELPSDQNPDDAGYLVEYLDGGKPNHPKFNNYISWSPTDVFEKAYQSIETALDRVNVELDELTPRYVKLHKFLNSSDVRDQLPRIQEILLPVQVAAMGTYTEVLELRGLFMAGPVDMMNYGDYDQPALILNVSFSVAQLFAQQGLSILRAGWNGKGMFVTYSPGQKDLPADQFWIAANKQAAIDNGGTMSVDPYYTLKTAQNTIQMGWLPTSGDLFANDWVVLLN